MGALLLQEREFDLTVLVYLAAFLLPVLARLVTGLVRALGRAVGVELPPPAPPAEPEVQTPPFFPVFEEEPPPAPVPPRRPERKAALPAGRSRAPAAPPAPPRVAEFGARGLTPSYEALTASLPSQLAHQVAATPEVVDPVLPAGTLPASRGDWRRAILLHEILSPPLALREADRAGGIPPFDLV